MTTTKSTTSNISDEDLYDSQNHIKVIWEDTLDNHSTSKEREIEKYFQKKYKTEKVKVIFKPILYKNSDVVAEGRADASEVILDENYQKQLIEQYLKDHNLKVNLPYLMKLDGTVNVELENYKEQTNRYKTFKVKDIEFSNFLSYGEGNKISYDTKLGITSVVSDPANYGGKTTLTVDLLLFLFFGKTTKADKYEGIFNKFTDSDKVEVKGRVEIEGDIYIIKRTLTRAKMKDNSYKCTNKLDFYQVLPRGGIKQLNGEQAKFTEELITTYVGAYEDFLITILTTGDNLDDLIKTKPTERGRILTKFIGLEFFREKEKIAKKKHAEWKEKSKLYKYTSQEISEKVENESQLIVNNQEVLLSLQQRLQDKKTYISERVAECDNLFKSRYNDVDIELYKTSEQDITVGIDKLQQLIKQKQNDINVLATSVPEPSSEYNIDLYGQLRLHLKETTEKEITTRLGIDAVKRNIETLKSGEICQACNRPLDDVDHSAEITKNETKLKTMTSDWEDHKGQQQDLTNQIAELDQTKAQWDSFNKNAMLIERYEVELKSFNDSLVRGNDKLNQFRKVREQVEKNKLIDTDIQRIKFNIDVLNQEKDLLQLQIVGQEKDIEIAEAKISEYDGLIKELKNEEVIDNIFKVYLEIYGKNGISKMVLSTMIPLINSHLKILLADSCEFNLEMQMDEKQEIEFVMVDHLSKVEKPLSAGSGYEKTISSLALRCVLSKVCSLPKPNIIVFDEVTGKVSNQNLDNIGLFFEKLKQFFDHIWIISHNPIIQDWADHRVLVKKVNNISQVNEE